MGRYNDINRLIDMILYVFPKYLAKADNRRNRSDSFDENKLENKLLEEFIKKVDLKELIHYYEKREDTKSKTSEKKDKQISSYTNKYKEKKGNEYFPKERCTCNISDMENILKSLVNKIISISIEGLMEGTIENALLLEVKNSIVKLRCKQRNEIIIPIQEIVGISSGSISSIKLSYNPNSSSICCDKCKELSRYFSSHIGKDVILRTKGGGRFRYTRKKRITAVGKCFVVLDNTMIISICKIVLVEQCN